MIQRRERLRLSLKPRQLIASLDRCIGNAPALYGCDQIFPTSFNSFLFVIEKAEHHVDQTFSLFRSLDPVDLRSIARYSQTSASGDRTRGPPDAIEQLLRFGKRKRISRARDRHRQHGAFGSKQIVACRQQLNVQAPVMRI